MEINFIGGINIAMKIPSEKYQETVAFYRDILLFDVEEVDVHYPPVLETHRLCFGANILWLDRVKDLTVSEIWLELATRDINSATNYLQANDITTCNGEKETIQSDVLRIKDPAGNILLMKTSSI